MHSTPSSSATATPSSHANTRPLVPFGKYRGTPLSDVPEDYLLWLGTRDDLRNPLLKNVLNEMARRLAEKDRQHECEAVGQ
jgi:uncharacterized protein (DUF3820 family)